MYEYNVTWSRPGLIGLAAGPFITNHFVRSKAAKTAPSRLTLIDLFDRLAIDLAAAIFREITGEQLTLTNSSLTSNALQEARKALGDVIVCRDRGL